MSTDAPSPATGSVTGRVVEMHHHTRRGLAMSGTFAIAAVTAVPSGTGDWLPLHLFLVGAVTIAIATVTQMLAVTWSAAPPPRRRILTLQRWALAVGAVLVVTGRHSSRELWIAIGGGLVASSLASVAIVLIRVRRTARTRRFAPAIDAYVLAIASALAGILLGIGLGTGALPHESSRDAHILVNLFAFVGVVIAGTLPSFAATQARTKMNERATPRRARSVSISLWASAGAAASAAALGHDDLVALALAAHAVGVVALITLLPRLHRKHVAWAGPRLLQMYAGIGWWVAATIWIAASYGSSGLGRAPLLTLVIGGYGQVLAASFAYLVPVVRGGGHARLGAGFDRTRSWAGLVLGSLAATFAVLGHFAPMTITLGAWAVDAVIRSAAPRRPKPAPAGDPTGVAASMSHPASPGVAKGSAQGSYS